MQINSISQPSYFNGSWQKATLKITNPEEALKVIQEIRHLAASVPNKKIYIKSLTANGELDITHLGNLGCLGIMGENNFLYRFTGKNYPKTILNAIRRCFSAGTEAKAKTIADKATEKYDFISMKQALRKSDMPTIMRGLRHLFIAGEKSNTEDLFDAIEKCAKAKTIADKTIDRYEFISLKRALRKSDMPTIMRGLRSLFKAGEKSNPEDLLNAIEKCAKATKLKEAVRIARSVTGQPIEV